MNDWLKVALVVAVVAVLAMLAVAVPLAVRVRRASALLRDSEVPASAKVATWGALVYFICPVDLLPDPVYLDDIVILLGALRHLKGVSLRGAAGKDPGTLRK